MNISLLLKVFCFLCLKIIFRSNKLLNFSVYIYQLATEKTEYVLKNFSDFLTYEDHFGFPWAFPSNLCKSFLNWGSFT